MNIRDYYIKRLRYFLTGSRKRIVNFSYDLEDELDFDHFNVTLVHFERISK